MRYWTYAEIRTKVDSDLDLGLDDDDNGFIKAAELLGYCNEAIDEAEGEIHTLYEDYFLTSSPLPLVSGQSAYTLPDGIFASKIRGIVYNDGSDVYPIGKFKEHKKFVKIAEKSNETNDDYQYMLLNAITPVPAAPAAWVPYGILEWVAGTSYVAGNQVTHLGNIYTNLLPTADVAWELYHTAVFTETFASATGFVLSDAAKIEITGGQVQQIDQRPVGSLFGATYSTGINGSWGNGVLTAIPVGSVHASNGGIVVPDTISCMRYAALGNATILQTGTFLFEWTAGYVTPSTNVCFIAVGESVAPYKNVTALTHSSTGLLGIVMTDNAGGTILISNFSAVAWAPTIGVKYELCLCSDLTTGDHRLFINGTQFGATLNATGTRDTTDITYLAIGGSSNSDSYGAPGTYDNIMVYNTILHTADYVAGYIVPETIYAECEAVVPDWEITTNIHKIYDLVPTSNGLERYTIQRCGSTTEFYFSGTGWVASNSTFAQANDIATFVANLDSLPATIADCCNIHILFPDGNTMGYVSNLVGSIGEYEWLLVGPTPNTYEVGDIVRYNNANYTCAIANANTAFVPANWTLLAPYSTVGVPLVTLKLIPAAQETSTSNVTIWYIRNANRMTIDADICDIPEFTSFVIQYMKVRCYEKEQNENLAFAVQTLEALRKKMVDTLSVKEPDDDNLIEMDLSDYADSTGV